ncbi:MAG: hypothetical protein ACO1RX_22970 [Candidatus Sericytochromatia bacterium]
MSGVSYFLWAIGPLNGVAFGLFLPVLGFWAWGHNITCQCSAYMTSSLGHPLFRLILILGAWLLIPLVDSGVCHVLLHRRFADTLRYLLWRWVQFLPALFLLLAMLSFNLIYFAVGILGLFVVFPDALGRSLLKSPVIEDERPLSSVSQLLPVLIYLIIFFFTPIMIPPSRSCECPKTFFIKSNMHTLQTVLETYAVAKGSYPPSIELPEKQLETWPSWRSVSNPVTGEQGAAAAYRDYGPAPSGHFPILASKCGRRWLGIPVSSCHPDTERAGQVLYHAKSPTSYVLYGVNGHGFLLEDDGKPYVLEGPPP